MPDSDRFSPIPCTLLPDVTVGCLFDICIVCVHTNKQFDKQQVVLVHISYTTYMRRYNSFLSTVIYKCVLLYLKIFKWCTSYWYLTFSCQILIQIFLHSLKIISKPLRFHLLVPLHALYAYTRNSINTTCILHRDDSFTYVPCPFSFQDIIKLVVGRLAAGERYFARCYALKLVHIQSRESYWLHNNLSMYQVRQKYESAHPPEEWR